MEFFISFPGTYLTLEGGKDRNFCSAGKHIEQIFYINNTMRKHYSCFYPDLSKAILNCELREQTFYMKTRNSGKNMAWISPAFMYDMFCTLLHLSWICFLKLQEILLVKVLIEKKSTRLGSQTRGILTEFLESLSFPISQHKMGCKYHPREVPCLSRRRQVVSGCMM